MKGCNLIQKSKINLLILGKNGFVGKNAVSYFSSKEEYTVKAISREEVDLEDRNSLQRFMKENRFDTVLNCAGYVGGIGRNINEPYKLIFKNLIINLNIIDVCGKQGIKIINFGSSCMYPSNAKLPLNISSLNEGNLDDTSKYFATSKLTIQTTLQAAEKEFGLEWTTIIPATIYGPHDNFSTKDGHVISSLIKKFYEAQSKNEKTVKLFGSGNTKREFIYISDLLEATNLVMVSNLSRKIVNIGTSSEIKIVELAKKLCTILNFLGEIKTDVSLPDGNNRRLLDSNEIYSLGWSPRVDLDSGLKSTVDWYKASVQLI